MPSLLAPLVGSYFRPPAKLILEVLPSGQSLVLSPEPFNEHDPNAIKVIVRISDINIPEDQADKISHELLGYGSTWEDFINRDECHLGYIAATGGKFCKIDQIPSKGNIEFLEIMGSTPFWDSTLTFSPGGQPLVKLSY